MCAQTGFVAAALLNALELAVVGTEERRGASRSAERLLVLHRRTRVEYVRVTVVRVENVRWHACFGLMPAYCGCHE